MDLNLLQPIRTHSIIAFWLHRTRIVRHEPVRRRDRAWERRYGCRRPLAAVRSGSLRVCPALKALTTIPQNASPPPTLSLADHLISVINCENAQGRYITRKCKCGCQRASSRSERIETEPGKSVPRIRLLSASDREFSLLLSSFQITGLSLGNDDRTLAL